MHQKQPTTIPIELQQGFILSSRSKMLAYHDFHVVTKLSLQDEELSNHVLTALPSKINTPKFLPSQPASVVTRWPWGCNWPPFGGSFGCKCETMRERPETALPTKATMRSQIKRPLCAHMQGMKQTRSTPTRNVNLVMHM